MLASLTLLALLASVAARTHGDGDGDADFESSRSSGGVPELHVRLFRWCMDDARCRAAYRVEPEQALTASTLQGFSLLATLWLPDEHADDEVRFIERHFSAASPEDEERLRWLVLLRLAAAEGASMRCGVNQGLVVSPDAREGHCLCLPDRVCEDGTNWHSVLNVATYAIVAATILLIVYACCGICVAFSSLQTEAMRQRQFGAHDERQR